MKFACGEWNLASPSEIASLWNICSANVRRRILFHIATNGSNISQFTEWIISPWASANDFTKKLTIMWEFEFIRKNAEYIFFVAHSQKNGDSICYRCFSILEKDSKIKNATPRWGVAATSSKTGGYHNFLQRRKCKRVLSPLPYWVEITDFDR